MTIMTMIRVEPMKTRDWGMWPALLLMGALSPCGHNRGRLGPAEPEGVKLHPVGFKAGRPVVIAECQRCRATFTVPRDLYEH